MLFLSEASNKERFKCICVGAKPFMFDVDLMDLSTLEKHTYVMFFHTMDGSRLYTGVVDNIARFIFFNHAFETQIRFLNQFILFDRLYHVNFVVSIHLPN